MKPQLELSNQICHRFYVATNAITRAYKPYLKQLDITYPQYLVLMALWQQDDIEVGQIQQQTKVDAGALSLIMKKLVQKGLIEMISSQQDKRVKLVKLTEAGAKMESAAENIPQQLRCQFPELSDAEVNQLRSLLDKLNSSLLAE